MCYNESVRGDDIMIKETDLACKFVRNMRLIARLGQESYGHKQRVQVLLGRDVLGVQRGIINHFKTHPTLIFIALVAHKYKSEASIGWAALYGP